MITPKHQPSHAPASTNRPSSACKLILAITALSALISGCATLQDLAPPLDERSLARAQSMGYAADRVERGRELYLSACVRCHSPEAVTGYSWDRWSEIIPRMAARARLDLAEVESLTAYIRVTLERDDATG